MKSEFLRSLKKTAKSLKGITYIGYSDKDEFISYKDIFKNAIFVGNIMKEKGVKKSQKVILQAIDFKDFVTYFIACILIDAIPIPLYLSKNDEQRKLLENLMNEIEDSYLLTSNINLNKNILVTNSKIAIDKQRIVLINNYHNYNISENQYKLIYDRLETKSEEDIAYIQFSSGSTGKPKGVVINYKNLISMIYDVNSLFNMNENSRNLNWLPLEHNIGLVLFLLSSLYNGCNLYLIDTTKFMEKPIKWIEKLSEYKINITASPNFGLEHISNSDINVDTNYLDLSELKHLICGGEIVDLETCDKFLNKFKKNGLKESVINPCYGMSESTLGIAANTNKNGINYININKEKINIGGKINEKFDDTNKLKIVSVGKPIKYCNVRISDNKGNILDDKFIGNIEINGEVVTTGYYNNSIANLNTFTKDKWLRTGDIGFLKDNEVYILGRSKDLIIVNGKKIHYRLSLIHI